MRLIACCTSGSKSCTPRLEPVEAELAQMRDGFGRRFARIDFDRIFAFGLGQQREVLARRGHQFGHFVVRQEGGRAAAPMQLRHGTRACRNRRPAMRFRASTGRDRDAHARGFSWRPCCSRSRSTRCRKRGCGSTARDRSPTRPGRRRRADSRPGSNVVAELQGGRIGRIPWTVRAVFGEQVGAEERVGGGHGAARVGWPRLERGGRAAGSGRPDGTRQAPLERGLSYLSSLRERLCRHCVKRSHACDGTMRVWRAIGSP